MDSPTLSQSELITDWTVDQVSSWLDALNYEKYAPSFAENGITGEILVHLDHPSLKDLGVTSVGHRLHLLKAIYQVKVIHDIPIESHHFIPATAALDGTGAMSGDPDLAWLQAGMRMRDERIAGVEGGMQKLGEQLAKLREELLPVFRMAKERTPLPTPGGVPDVAPTAAAGIGRSATTSRARGVDGLGVSSPPPPRRPNPPPPLNTVAANAHQPLGLKSSTSTPSLSTAASLPSTSASTYSSPPSASASKDIPDAFKSFRVSLDDPCSRVLPAALRRYRITGSPNDYALYIVYTPPPTTPSLSGAPTPKMQQVERLLRDEEKPLLLFQQLQREGAEPVFRLGVRPGVKVGGGEGGSRGGGSAGGRGGGGPPGSGIGNFL
ncbi:hypothetical protein YB2330_005506 [Saitoella coloradoensis]